MNRPRIILSVINDLVTDQRVHKIATSLHNNIGDVLVIGRVLPDSLPIKREYETHRMKLLFKKGPLFYAEYNIRLYLFLIFSKSDILVANDLDTLPANTFASVLKKGKLVYDAHEFFTEVPELVERPKVKSVWQKLEHFLIGNVQAAYTVCQSLAELFRETYGVSFNVVRNIPQLSDKPVPPINGKGKTVLYQGAVNLGRGLELMLDTLVLLPDVNLIIAGGGDVLNQLKDKVHKLDLTERVTFTGKLPFEQLQKVTHKADIGISIEEDLGLNYRFALPNKLFDYIHCGKPVIVSDLPEMRRIVETYKVGEVLKERTPKALAAKIETMLHDSILRQQYRNNCLKAREELNWQKEEQVLLNIYRQLL